MPPDVDPLPADVVRDIEQWILDGAADPRDHAPSSASAAAQSWDAKLAERREAWCWQPVGDPSVPQPSNDNWSTGSIDRFVLSKLRDKGLRPAIEASKRVLVRRASFTLTGLPPTAEEVDHYLADKEPGSFERLIDRLLASPRFGERWARFWMDWVGYADTHGDERDEPIPMAWRYRDYLIRALNDDIPYDQMLREHVAGDQLLDPRWSDTGRGHAGRTKESILATGFFHLGEMAHSPVDVKLEEARVIDGQIEVLSKAFQGLTLSCARCHDHKFDALSTRDYYSVWGILASSRHAMVTIDDPEWLTAGSSELESLKQRLREALAKRWLNEIPSIRDEIRSALLSGPKGSEKSPAGEGAGQEATIAADARVDAWRAVLFDDAIEDEGSQTRQFASFGEAWPEGWSASGAFDSGVAAPGDFAVLHEGDQAVRAVYPSGAYTHLLSEKHGGSLRSPDFTIDDRFILAEVVGGKYSIIRLVIANNQILETPLFGKVNRVLRDDRPHWVTLGIRDEWIGQRAYLEVATRLDVPHLRGRDLIPKDSELVAFKQATDGRSLAGLLRVVFQDDDKPPPQSPLFETVTDEGEVDSRVRDITRLIQRSIESWREQTCTNDQARHVDWLLKNGMLSNTVRGDAELESLLGKYRATEASVPVARRAHALVDDGQGRDARIYVRGNHRSPGDVVPRGYLEVLAGHQEGFSVHHGDRLRLADELADPANPLTARVAVNRVWGAVFGRGLVGTPDNFGALGEAPSHPELLDHLASRFVRDGWSIKALVRRLMISSAWRMSSEPSPESVRIDPNNRLLQHANLRRLDAESIRDSLLYLAGELNEQMFGPGVPPRIPPTVKVVDEGRPEHGTLDGDRRRSIYLLVRRNYPDAFLSDFGQPIPTGTLGRRSDASLTSHALTLLNDPLVHHAAQQWAWRLVGDGYGSASDPENAFRQRIDTMYKCGLGRPVAESELSWLWQFAHERPGQKTRATADLLADASVWKDLAHCLFNFGEFIYVQ